MAEQQNPVISDSEVQRILSTIKEVESSGNYGAKAKGSSASGAYQFINDTWQRSTKRYGIGTEYKTAADAPPEVQDAVAARAVKDILGQVGGDVTKVPLVWYTGNPQGRITEEALRVNRGLTPDKYQQKWMSVFNQGRPTTTTQAQAPAQAPRTPVQGTQVAAAAKPSLTDMPPAYRMALAANYLADTESPETSVVERAMEMLNEQQGGAAKNPLAGYMQAMGQESVNPFQFVQQQEEEAPRRAVPRMPVRMEKGGEVNRDEFDQQREQERQSRLVEQGLSYAMGPMNIRAVRKPAGYEARVSGSFNQVVPYMDFDPLTGTFRPTEVGVSYGQMGPEGGYRFQYGQPLPREGQPTAPPQVTGQYRRQLDRNSEVQASGYYVPIPGAKDQYGAQFRYLQRFADGGEAVSDEAIRGYLQANPTLTDRQIAAKMDEFNVSKEQMARATGIGLPEVTARYEATRVDPSTISEDVRQAVQSQRLTRDQYATLSNYFGNPLTTAELTSADAPTIRDFVNKPRTGFEFASFLATRGPRHGGNNPYGMTLYENLLQPYLNTTQTQFQQDESGGSILDPITGQYRPVSQVDQNRYRVQYSPIFSGPSGSGETRTDVGLDYVVDPATGRATLASPYLREFTPKKDRGLNTLLGIAGTVAGYYFFPGMDMNSMFNRALITAGTEGAKRMFNDGGEVVYRQAGSPEEGEVAAQQMTVGTMLPPPEPPPPVPIVRPGVTIPTIREVPQVDAQGRVIREAPAPARAFTPGQQVVGAGEAVLSAVSGLTAPASIVYDLARGVPTKDVSPGRFMYEPRTEAGQEMLQDVGRLAQEYKLDVAMPQVQLQRPYPVGAAARQGIVGLEKGVEKMTLPAFRQITGNPNATKEQMMDFVLNQKSIMQAGAPAIVKPKGGTFVSGEHSTFDNALEDITSSINSEKQTWGYVHDAGDMIKKLETISDFFNTRFKNYYQKKLGSQDDPLRDAFLRGDFNGGDWFNVQELNDIRARIANPQTSSAQKEELLRLLNSKYDAWTDINAIVPERNSIGKKLAYPSSESVNVIQKKLKEQGVNVDKKDISVTAETRDNYLIGDKGLNAINQGDVAYDVGSSPTLSERAALIKDYLMTLNPNQVKNITFEDAIIGAERYHEALKNPAIKFTPQELFEGREKMFNAGDKYQWSEIKTVEALKREGLAMDHCIQGDDYCMQLTSGIGRHFSLQDAKTGIPHTTISTYRSPFAGPESKHVVIGQIKGHSNSVASKYFDEVEKFLTEYEKQVGKIYITEKPKFIPPAFKKAEYTTLPRGYEGNQYAKGGMVDKPLYDRAA